MATKTSSTTPVTGKQIGKLQKILCAALRKSGLPGGPATNHVIKTQGQAMVNGWVADFTRRVDAVSKLVRLIVKGADRTKSPQQMLDLTGRKQYTDREVVDSMPRGKGKGGEVFFYKPDLSARDGHISNDDLETEINQLDFKSADPYLVIQANIDDTTLADTRPHATHWKGVDGKWYYIAFDRWHDEPYVSVDGHDDDWNAYWSFPVVRK